MKSFSGDQLAPPFRLFQIPPATPAAYIMLGSTGSIRRALVRPPTLPGPSDSHVPRTPPVAPPPRASAGPKLFLSRELKSTSLSPVSACDAISLLRADEKRFICLTRSLAAKYRSTGSSLAPLGRR